MKIPMALKGTRGAQRSGRRHVNTVLIPVSTRELIKCLDAMREWLDHRGVEPSDFRYTVDRAGSEATVSVGFKIDDEATEFATAFDDPADG
jgi:hypothetical protein